MKSKRRAFNLSETHITKLQLMKTMDPDKSITYNEIVRNAIDFYWALKYKEKAKEIINYLR